MGSELKSYYQASKLQVVLPHLVFETNFLELKATYSPEMAETTEFLTLLNCTGKLEIALQSDRELAQFLNKEGFITDEVYADVSSTTSVQTSIQKAGTLIFHIKNKVKLNPKRYHKLVCHLRQNKRKYEDIVNILEEEYYRLVCDSSQDDHTDVSQMDAVDVPSYQKQGGMCVLYDTVYDINFISV